VVGSSNGSKWAKKVRITPTSRSTTTRTTSGQRRDKATSYRTVQEAEDETGPEEEVSEAERENLQLRATLNRMQEKLSGVKRAISGEPIHEWQKVIRETRMLRGDLREIFRQELAAFGNSFLRSYVADACLPLAKRRRLKGEEEEEHASPTSHRNDETDVRAEKQEGREEAAEDRRADHVKQLDEALQARQAAEAKVHEMELELEKERQKNKSVEEDMQKVKRKTKIVYERYIILKKKKDEMQDELKKSEKEKAELKKANDTFVGTHNALSESLREATAKAKQVDKAREKVKRMKKQIQEITLFRDKQTERVRVLEAECKGIRHELTTLRRQLHKASETNERLEQQTSLLERHNAELLAQISRLTMEAEKAAHRSAQKGKKEHDEPSQSKENVNQMKETDQEEEEGGSPPMTLTGFTCPTTTQSNPIATPLTVPTLMELSQDSEDIFAKGEAPEQELASPILSDDEEDEEEEDEEEEDEEQQEAS